jgi:long-chain acyl-CoA synthetase
MAKNVAELWRSRTRETPDALAFEHRVAGTWTPVTWRQADERVRRVAAGLVARGVARGDRVALLASTRLEWILCDFGVLCAGAAVSTVYPSNTADEVAFVLEDAGCVAVVVEDAAQLQKLRQEQARLGAVRLVVVIDPAGCDGDGWLALSTLEDEGGRALAADPACVDARIDATGPEDLATLIYTSGTTGRPKGVMLVHDNWLVQAEAITADLRPHLQPGDKQYLFLPLAHSFGKICELIAVAVGIPTAVEGRIDLVVDGLLATRPTILCAVPRVFEKISARIRNGAAQKGPRAVAVLKWAQRVGAERLARQDAGRRVGVRLTIQHAIADRLVFRKLRDALGGRIRAFLSGGAPLSIDLAVFFRAAGMVILEGYGLTETAAASTANRLDDFAFGTVGKPFEGGQVAIAPRRRGAAARAPRDAGLLEPAAGHRRRPRRRRLVPHRGSRLGRRRRAAAHHRPQEGPHHHVGRQEHRPARHREPAQGRHRARGGAGDAGRPPQLLRRARVARPPRCSRSATPPPAATGRSPRPPPIPRCAPRSRRRWTASTARSRATSRSRSCCSWTTRSTRPRAC